MRNFDTLQQRIGHLKARTIQQDKEGTTLQQVPFDRQLFNTRSRRLEPYIDEIQHTFNHLVAVATTSTHLLEKAEYLSERLIHQLQAVEQMLRHHHLTEASQPSVAGPPAKPAHYQDLAQYDIWERRLRQMIADKQRALASCAPEQQAHCQHTICALKQRLLRCQQAKLHLEHTLTASHHQEMNA